MQRKILLYRGIVQSIIFMAVSGLLQAAAGHCHTVTMQTRFDPCAPDRQHHIRTPSPHDLHEMTTRNLQLDNRLETNQQGYANGLSDGMKSYVLC